VATINVYCRANYNQELGTRTASFLPANSYANPIVITKGDIVNFIFQETGDATGYLFLVYAFDSGYWTDTSNSPITNPNGTVTRQTIASAVVGSGYIDTLVVDMYGPGHSMYPNLYIKITDGIDATPDAFSVGPSYSGVSTSDRIAGAPFTVTGINTPVSASCSAGADFTVNGGSSVTSATVQAGDKIQLFVTSPSSWGASRTGTMTVGGVSASFTVTTATDPGTGQVINFPKVSLPISLTDVINFFGGTSLAYPPYRNLRAYLKGGSYVPNITKNASVPSSGNLSLSQFAGSGTSLIFSVYPKAQSVSGSTSGVMRTLSITWGVGLSGNMGFDVGYGPGMKGAVEYRYTLSQSSGGMLSTGIQMTSNTGSPGTWSEDNTSVTLSQTHQNLERRYSGVVTIQIRSKFNNAVIVSISANYSFNFYGV
jgi:hypothetical protein